MFSDLRSTSIHSFLVFRIRTFLPTGMIKEAGLDSIVADLASKDAETMIAALVFSSSSMRAELNTKSTRNSISREKRVFLAHPYGLD